MTLSRLTAVIYVIVSSLGAGWGMLEMFGSSIVGAQAFFIYLGINLVQGYGVYLTARKMMKYTYSLQNPSKQSLIDTSNCHSDKSAESEESSDDERR